ncbi:MAG: hypothetical protein ACD_79C00300G0002 [uncultured bacterium]|nr:MAG: hypothetical protein ACD_79C00300G0002 [uncultured bacterium]
MIKINQKLILREENSEAILFDPESLLTAWLNESAIEVWKYLCEGLTVEEIQTKMQSSYSDIDSHKLKSDINEIIEHFKNASYIYTE